MSRLKANTDGSTNFKFQLTGVQTNLALIYEREIETIVQPETSALTQNGFEGVLKRASRKVSQPVSETKETSE